MVRVAFFFAIFFVVAVVVQAWLPLPRRDVDCTLQRHCKGDLLRWMDQVIAEKCSTSPPFKKECNAAAECCGDGNGCDCDWIVENCC